MLTGGWLENTPGIAVYALALLIVARSFRGDTRYASFLQRRVDEIAAELAVERSRRRRLEAFMRTAGIPVPPWDDDEAAAAKEKEASP